MKPLFLARALQRIGNVIRISLPDIRLHLIIGRALRIHIGIVSRILVSALKEARLRRTLLHGACLLIIIGECVAHADPPADPFSLAELEKMSQICDPNDNEHMPLVSWTRAIHCSDLGAYVYWIKDGKTREAELLTETISIGGTNGK